MKNKRIPISTISRREHAMLSSLIYRIGEITPKDLTKEEKEILARSYGKNWMKKIGRLFRTNGEDNNE